jgi:hypothetical protein
MLTPRLVTAFDLQEKQTQMQLLSLIITADINVISDGYKNS